VPVMPVVPSVAPTGVPAMPAVAPAAVPPVPVMPTPTVVPAPSTGVMRVVEAVAVARLVPAVTPSVAYGGDPLNVRWLRGLTRNRDRHRRRRCARKCNNAESGEANKCRNKFHDIHLLTLTLRGGGDEGFGVLRRFNTDEQRSVSFPIFNWSASNGAFAGVHQSLYRWRLR
jgi:hypothetical protein